LKEGLIKTLFSKKAFSKRALKAGPRALRQRERVFQRLRRGAPG
jgi:hypothetical protein